MNNYCFNCGEVRDVKHKFCPNCGISFENKNISGHDIINTEYIDKGITKNIQRNGNSYMHYDVSEMDKCKNCLVDFDRRPTMACAYCNK